MSEADIQQLVEMGASVAKARAAMAQYKDVMQAAERIFEGKFDHIQDDDAATPLAKAPIRRPITPDDDEDDDDDAMGSDDEAEQDDSEEEYIDYDSDFQMETTAASNANVDPYSGIFFSKDRREEVIEIEEVPELMVGDDNAKIPIMTQGEWMKGCPEGAEQSHLFGLYSKLSTPTFRCPQDCGGILKRNKGDFLALYDDFTKYIKRLRNNVVAQCPRCHSKICLSCGEPISNDQEKHAASREDPLFHCSDLQGVILGVGLTMLDEAFRRQDQEVLDTSEGSARTTKRRRTDQARDNDEDGSPSPYEAPRDRRNQGGTGYAGNNAEDVTGQLKAQAIQRLRDESIAKLLTAVREYLPNLNREGGARTSDYLVHPTALAHLRRRFNHVCSRLLQNDSLADMSDRSVLYYELLQWLETISNHEALASMMAMPIMVVASVKATTAKNGQARERTIVYEGSSGPRELLEGIAIQASAAIKGLEGAPKPVDESTLELTEEQKRMTTDMREKLEEENLPSMSDENMKLLSFCRSILGTVKAIDRSLRDTKGDAFVDRLHASLPKISSSSTSTSTSQYRVDATATDEAVEKAYMEWATRVRFEYCDLTVPEELCPVDPEDFTPHYKSVFNNEARMLAGSDIPKRSLAIAKELAILTTNLPISWSSSIFLRVDESRVDVIKAMITGPEDTPYHNGCYLFDIFLGPSYNQSPPSVKYMTTNGGKFRFNPNLYADGKVCLSLLGTWQGPGWVAGKSTLLQVLISIQSMILCDEPYLNEPGWANSAGTPSSKAYSANVRRQVVRTAMLGNLKNPPEPFADIIKTHFRLKARSISAQLTQWLAEDDSKPVAGDGGMVTSGSTRASDGGNYSFKKDVEELKAELRSLENE